MGRIKIAKDTKNCKIFLIFQNKVRKIIEKKIYNKKTKIKNKLEQINDSKRMNKKNEKKKFHALTKTKRNKRFCMRACVCDGVWILRT